MNYAIFQMGINQTLSFDCAEELGRYLTEQEYNYGVLAGVSFDMSINKTDDDLPEHLIFSLRFRTRLEVNAWKTNSLFPQFQEGGPRNLYSSTGGPPNYYNDQFIALQSAISMAFIKSLQDVDEELPEIVLQRFPYPATTVDTMANSLKSTCSFILFISFAFVCTNNVKVKEKKIIKNKKFIK